MAADEGGVYAEVAQDGGCASRDRRVAKYGRVVSRQCFRLSALLTLRHPFHLHDCHDPDACNPLHSMTDHTDDVSVDSPHSPPSFRSRSSTKVVDDVTSLTSFNPFSEEDEHDQSSYALVTSLFSKVKNTLSAPLSAAGPSTAPAHPSTFSGNTAPEQRRPSLNYSGSNQSNKPGPDRPTPFSINVSNPAPPLVSLTPVVSETPSYTGEYDRPPSRGAAYTEILDGGGYAIPGFPIQDSDARSIRTNGSFVRSASVSKVIRRIRGEGNYILV